MSKIMDFVIRMIKGAIVVIPMTLFVIFLNQLPEICSGFIDLSAPLHPGAQRMILRIFVFGFFGMICYYLGDSY